MGSHRRFYIKPEQISGETAILTGDTARQISRVLRLTVGDKISLMDGAGAEYTARISSITKTDVTAIIESSGKCACDPTLRLVLAVCLPKSDKMDLIVQKGTELGISEVVAVISERVVALPQGSRLDSKLERWRKIATEAAEQCGRSTVPAVTGPVAFDDLLKDISQYDLALMAWENEQQISLKDTLAEKSNAKSVLLIIGPEGGLTEREVELARSAEVQCVSFGRRILRCETAAIAGAAAVMFALEGEL